MNKKWNFIADIELGIDFSVSLELKHMDSYFKK